jgi:hypothetical protein
MKRFLRNLAIRAGWYAIEQLIPKLEGKPNTAALPRSPLRTPTKLDAQVVDILKHATSGLALWQIATVAHGTMSEVQGSMLKLMERGLVVVNNKRRYSLPSKQTS